MKIKELIKKYYSVIMYLIFGALTTAVNVAVYHACYTYVDLSNTLSTVIAWVAAVTFAFFTNKAFVFNSKSWETKVVISEGAKFYASRIGTGIIELGLMYLLVDVLGFAGTLMKLLVNIIVIILNYVFSKLIVFRNTPTADNSDDKKSEAGFPESD